MDTLPLRRTENSRMLATLGLAMLFHAVLLFGVSIHSAQLTPHTLEVTLVTLAADKAPWRAHVLAPEAQSGSGEGPNERARAEHSVGMIDVPGIRTAEDAVITSPSNTQSGSSGQTGTSAARVVTSTSSNWQQDSDQTSAQSGADSEQRLIRREQAGVGPKDAEFNQLATAPGAVDPSRPLAPDARPDPSAAYLDAWRREVERVGSANFPWDALVIGRGNSLTLQVAIRANGTISLARVERSSGQPLLDRAALNILNMAAPFPPFPQSMRQNMPELRFSYVWEFLPGDASSSGGAALRVVGE